MSLIVEVKQGKLQGRENSSVLTEQKYYTFSGIPYAKPPIGDLRFKDPEPYEKWEGIYDATYERDSCFQKSQTGQNWEGSEDCLYLNVNTPEIPSEIKVPKAVMVFIHGGGFYSGSGSEKMYSADYLIPHDVILVTMNYRLHVLGFLSLGIKECAGNAALKDQSLALKWVKENIKQFGGDPNNITVFGNSAGGASVHFQIISPLSKGLFNKAIIQSGDIFVPWAKIQFNPKDIAKQLGIKLGFVGEDRQKLVEFLRQQHIESLFDAYTKVTAEIKKKYPLGFRPGPFSPCIEEIKEGAFLPDSPAELVKNTAPLPIIYGVTDKEGYLFAGNFPKDRLLELNEDFSIILKSNFKIMPEKLAEVSAEIKKYFLCDENVGDKTAEQVTNLFSDIMYFQMYEAIDFVTSSSIPPYLYEYNYDKGPNNFKNFGAGFFENFESQGLPKNFPGASHGAEIPSIFFSKNGSHPPPTDPDRLAVIKNVTTLWTNFAKSGIPNNDKTAWTPSKSNKPCYLKINTNLEMTEGTIYGEGLQFLRDVLVPVIIPP